MTQELSRPHQGGLQLRTVDDYMRLAQIVCKSGMAPRNSTPESLMVCMIYGKEVGISEMQAIQNVANINGKPGLYGDAMLGICMASGLFDEAAFQEAIEGDGDSRVAVCRVRRLPNGIVKEARFSVQDAKRAKLWGKQGPWSDYPERMLQMRARSFALRDTFPDVLKGLIAVEELRDYPQDATPAPAPRQTVEVIPPAAIAHEPKPKPIPVKYGEYGQRLYELLLQEASTEAEADALIAKWTQGNQKSHKRVCSDEVEAAAVLEELREEERFAQTAGQLFDDSAPTGTGVYGEGV